MERPPTQPQQPLQQYVYPDDEISLYEIWDILVRRRLLIGATAIAFIIAAAAYSMLQTQTYAVDLMLSVGERPSTASDDVSTVLIEPPASLVSRLNEVIIPAVRSQQAERVSAADEALPAVQAEVSDAAAGLVRLSATTTEARVPMAQALLTRIAEQVVDAHEQQLARQTDALRDQIMVLRAEVERLARLENQIQPDISAIGGSDSGAEASAAFSLLVSAMLDNSRQSERVNYELRRWKLESALAELHPTELVREARLGGQQGQSMTLMIGLGAVLGLMLGVFGAFGREFLTNAAAHRQEQLSK